MRLELKPHPGAKTPAIRIEAQTSRPEPALLDVRFTLTGAVGLVRLPPPGIGERSDKLWRHTCFEAFVRAPGEAGYVELNFAPSGQWAAYRFSDYRSDKIPADVRPGARAASLEPDGSFELAAAVDLNRELGLLDDQPWQVGLSAVIEERSGRISHWALAHPPGAPDFHHRDCFVLELPPPKPA